MNTRQKGPHRLHGEEHPHSCQSPVASGLCPEFLPRLPCAADRPCMPQIPSGFVHTEIPARVADLALGFAHPHDWVVADLPEETPDFTKPQTFLALAIAMAPFAAIVFGVGARPIYDDGSLAEWLEWLARDQGYDPGPIEHETALPQPAVGCWAMQQSGDTMLRMRLVLFEDGGRLIQLTMMAPQALWQSVHDTFWTMYASLRLARPKGSSAALAPAGVALVSSSYISMRKPQEPGHPAEAEQVDPPEQPEQVGAVEPPAAEPDSPTAGVPSHDTGPAATYAQLALADDTGTLLPEHPINHNLLQNGVGFPLRIITDHGPAARFATVLAPALQATLCLPYGWHAIDDSRRCLVHNGTGGIQIDVTRRSHRGLDADAFLRETLASMQAENPALEGERTRFNDVETMLVRGILDDGEPLAQVWLLRDAPQQQYLTLRCTARPDEIASTGNLAELIVRDTQFLDREIEGPPWWQQAIRLLQQGLTEAAEQCIQQAVPHLGAYAQIAHLHELRGHHLTILGDAVGARMAFLRSCEWMDQMAANATSGGEGAAHSLERDQHRKRLNLG